jgi:hypothetical protein
MDHLRIFVLLRVHLANHKSGPIKHVRSVVGNIEGGIEQLSNFDNRRGSTWYNAQGWWQPYGVLQGKLTDGLNAASPQPTNAELFKLCIEV